jgi:UDP-glucose 4-epimerase
MRVTVTGGAGFVGHHIAQAFLDMHASVVVIDNLSAGVNLTPKGAELRQVNIRHVAPKHLEDADLIVHAAARADVSKNWDCVGQRSWLYEDNIQGTVALLESAPHGTPFVFLSTGAVYGDTMPGALSTERHVCTATSPYAASKLAGEAMVQAYAHEAGLPWWVLRLPCVVGSGYHHGHIADMVAAVKATGRFHARNDGHTKKSMVHVDAVAQACLAALSFLDAGIYNVAHGSEEWSWRETAEVMRETRGFVATGEDQTHGWIGDPMARMSGAKLGEYSQTKPRSVAQGVRDALGSLGW